MLDQIHKLLARLSLLEKACEIRGSRQGILFLHATHLHAEVFGSACHYDAFGGYGGRHGAADLCGEVFLHLKPACKSINYSRQFAQTHNFAVGDIANGNSAEEGQDVVFAQRVELNVAHNDH